MKKLKHKFLLFLNKIRFKKKVKVETERLKVMKDKKPFKQMLLVRKDELEGKVAGVFGFNDKETKKKELLEARLTEVEKLITRLKDYGEE